MMKEMWEETKLLLEKVAEKRKRVLSRNVKKKKKSLKNPVIGIMTKIQGNNTLLKSAAVRCSCQSLLEVQLLEFVKVHILQDSHIRQVPGVAGLCSAPSRLQSLCVYTTKGFLYQLAHDNFM